MKSLRQLHLYLGCFFAPLLVVFALTGIAQIYELHESSKDGSYVAPAWLEQAATLHKHATLSKADPSAGMRALVAVMGGALVATMGLGVVLAFKSGRRPLLVVGSITAGIVVPLTLLLL